MVVASASDVDSDAVRLNETEHPPRTHASCPRGSPPPCSPHKVRVATVIVHSGVVGDVEGEVPSHHRLERQVQEVDAVAEQTVRGGSEGGGSPRGGAWAWYLFVREPKNCLSDCFYN